MSPAKALRLALAQAGEDLLGSAILTGTVEEARTTVPQMADMIEDGALVVLLDGPARARGLAILDPGALAAVIEALTTGRITSGASSASPRCPTATDAFLCARFLTETIGAFATHLAALPEADWAAGFSAGDHVRDARNLPLLLQDVAFRSIAAPMDFDAGLRSGRLQVVLPWVSPRPAARALPAPSPVVGETSAGHGTEQARADASAKLMQGEVALEAVLHRVRLPLVRLAEWKPGDLVPFPVHAIGAVSLVDAAGVPVAKGRLGQARGHRAVKIVTQAFDERALSPLDVAAPTPASSRVGAPQDAMVPLQAATASEETASTAVADIGDRTGTDGRTGLPEPVNSLPDLTDLASGPGTGA